MDYFYELFKEMYYYEQERKDRISARVLYPTTIVIVLGGVIGFYIANYNYLVISVLNIIFSLLTIGIFICTIISIYCLIRANFGYSYAYIATPEGIDEYIKEMNDYYEQTEEPNRERQVMNKTSNILKTQFIENGTKNRKNNNRRTEFIYYAIRWIVLGLIFLLASLPIFCIKTFTA